MKTLILIIFSISSLSTFGQKHLVGLKYGINSTNIITDLPFIKLHSQIGFSVGLSYDYLKENHFLFGIDFLYNQRGFGNDIIFRDNLGNPTGEKEALTWNYDYLSFPIRAGYTMGQKLYAFVNIGLVPSFLTQAKFIEPQLDNTGKPIGTESIDQTKFVSKFDLAGLFEICGGYKFEKKYWLFTSFSYQQSFNTITNSEYFSNNTMRHVGMTLTLGLKYTIEKK